MPVLGGSAVLCDAFAKILCCCNKCLTSLLTNLLYQPPHQPPLPASSPTSFTSLLTNLLYQPPSQPPSQPLIIPPSDLSHIFPIFSTCAPPTVHYSSTSSIILESLLLPSSLTPLQFLGWLLCRCMS